MRAPPNAFLTVGFASVAHAFSHMFMLFYATVVLVLQREWQLPYAELFALSLPGAILFGAAALPAGWLGDRWSASGMLAVFFFGLGGAAIATGLAVGPWSLAAGLSAIGLFAAIYHPVGIPWLVKHAVNRGRALGINGVFGSAGTAAAALVAGALTYQFGWRAAFLAPGALALLMGLLFVLSIRRGLIVEGREDAAPQPVQSAADRRRAFAALAVGVTCTGLIFQATSYALPKIFEERLFDTLGGSVLGVGGVVSICYAISAATQLLGGELADRFRLKSVYLWGQVLQVPVYVLAFSLFHPALIGVAMLMLSLNVLGQPAENSLLARYTPLRWRGQVFGAKFVLTLGVSAGGVALIPVIHARTGSLDMLFLALALFALTAAFAAWQLPNERRARTAPAAAPAEGD